MSILTRYYVKELLKVFTLTLCLLTVFMLWIAITFELPEDLKSIRLVWVLPFLLPEAVRNALQAASLFAACTVFGRMSAQNELVALNSLGIPAGFVLLPALMLGLAAGFTGVWLYEVGVSWGTAGVERALIESIDAIAYEQLEKTHSFSLPQIVLRAKGVDGRKLTKATAVITPTPDGDTTTIHAEECRLEVDPARNSLTVFFRNGTIEYEGHKLNFYDTIEQIVPLNDAEPDKDVWPPKGISLREIRTQIKSKEATIARLEHELSDSVVPIPAPNDDAKVDESQPAPLTPAEMREQLKTERSRLHYLQTQVYRRWTNGFFSLAFVMVGVPVAILLRSGDPLSAFFLCFAPVILVNHPLHNFCIRMAETGRLPPWSPWIGNVVLMSLGVWLLHRLNRPGSHEFLKRFKFLVYRLREWRQTSIPVRSS
jgi:lipopolysaccharide export system permease protein